VRGIARIAGDLLRDSQISFSCVTSNYGHKPKHEPDQAQRESNYREPGGNTHVDLRMTATCSKFCPATIFILNLDIVFLLSFQIPKTMPIPFVQYDHIWFYR
jgi:hypothetical protein